MAAPGLGQPWWPQLLRFNQLPSLGVHPQHAPLLSPPEGLQSLLASRPGVLAALHRQWSARLLQGLGAAARPLLDLAQPALALALLDATPLQRLARDLGLALLGRKLRHLIARDEVLALRQVLSAEELRWALDDASNLHPGLQDTDAWLAHGWAAGPELLGSAVLAQAWSDAPEPLARRANWRLPPAATAAQARAATQLSPDAARGLCLRRLEQTEPAWLSCFTATR